MPRWCRAGHGNLHAFGGCGCSGAIYMLLRGFDAAGNLSVALLEVVPRQKGIPFYVRHPRLDVAAFRVRFPTGVECCFS